MTLDFDNLDNNQLADFCSVRCKAVEDYNKISSDLLGLAKDNICWLSSNITGRNVNHSRLLYYLNCLALLDNYKERKIEIEKIYTSDSILFNTLKKAYNVCYKGNVIKKRWLLRYHIVIDLLKYVVWCIMAYSSKSKLRKNNVINAHVITIIDTFIPKKGDRYNDRYYGGIINNIPLEDNNRLFFLAQYLPVPCKKEVDRLVNNSKEQILFLFDFLKFKDYLHSLFIRREIHKVSIPCMQYKGFDLKYIFKESSDRYCVKYYYSSAILYDRFFLRLKEAGVDLTLFVDWFENQSYDRACNFSIQKYYPNAEIHGFMGAIMDFSDFPHNLATNEELDACIAPSQLYLCNKMMRDAYKASGYKGDLKLAPTFQAQKIWSIFREISNDNLFTILIPLGLVSYEVNYKVNFFVNFLKTQPQDIKIVIKPHPIYPIDEIKEIIEKNHVDIEIGTGDIYNFLKNANAVVGSNSTTLYEALGLGIPIISIMDNTGQLNIHRPLSVSDEMWYEVKDVGTLMNAVSSIKNTSQVYLSNEGIRLKDYFFEPVTKESTCLLLDINK